MTAIIDDLLAGMTRAESTGLTDEEQRTLAVCGILLDEIITAINAKKDSICINDALDVLAIAIGTTIRDYAPNNLEKIYSATQLATKILNVAMESPKSRGP